MPVCVWSACGLCMSRSEFLSFSGCLCAWLCTNQHCLILRDSNLASPLRWEFSNQCLCHFPSTSNGLDFFFSFLSPPLQPNCNFKSVWCKYHYCWRRNQTFMKERDLGSSRESRSRMRWQVSETATSPSVPFSLFKPRLCLDISLLFPLFSFSHLILVISPSPSSPLSPHHPFFLSSHLYSSTLSFHSLPSHLLSIAPAYIPFFIQHIFCFFGVQVKKKKEVLNHYIQRSQEMWKHICIHV